MNKKRWFNMKKTEQIGNIKIITERTINYEEQKNCIDDCNV